MCHVLLVVGVVAGLGGEPGVEDLLSSGSEVNRRLSASTLASFQRRAPSAVYASVHRAARTPATLFAAIDAPVPVQQQTTAWSEVPAATSRAAASEQNAHWVLSPGLSAPCVSTSWPRARNSVTRCRATGSSMSEETEIRMPRRLRSG